MTSRLAFFLLIVLTINPVQAYISYKHSDVTFDTKVASYLKQAKEKTDSVKEGMKLLGSISLLHSQASLDKIGRLAKEIQHADLPTTEKSDQIRAAAFIKLSVPIVERFKKELLRLICQLEISKQYWEYQQEHPASYATASPLNWVLGKKNEDVSNKIRSLDAFLDLQFSHLGSLSVHLDTFDEHKSPEDQYAWIQQLGTIIISSYPNAKNAPEIVTANRVMHMLIKAAWCVNHYYGTSYAHMRSFLMPHVLKRDWVHMITALTATYFGSQYAYAKRDTIKDGAVKGYQNVSGYAVMQYKSVESALFGGDELKESEATLRNDYEHSVLGLYNAMTYVEPNNESKKEGKKVQNPLSEQAFVSHPALDEFAGEYPEKRKNFNPQVIHEKAQSLDVKYFNEVVFTLISHVASIEGRQVGVELQKIGQLLKTTNFSVGSNLFGLKDGNIPDLIGKIGNGPIEKLSPLMDTLNSFSPILFNYIRLREAAFERNVMKKQVISFAIVSAIPAYLVLWVGGKGLYALYKKIRGVAVFDSVRMALVDTAMLLNVYGNAQPSAMAPQDYGKLLYLIHKLQREQYNVPREFKASFIHDVRILQSSTLSAAQKLQAIDLMYKRYPFLLTDPRYSGAAA